VTSYTGHAFVSPIDLIRSSALNYGIKPNLTLPLPWWILTDSSNRGYAEQPGVDFAPKLRVAAYGMDGDGLTAVEQLGIASNVVYSRRGTLDICSVRKFFPGSPQPFPPAASSQALLETMATSLLFNLRMLAMRCGMHP
jgi:hypothetical protein